MSSMLNNSPFPEFLIRVLSVWMDLITGSNGDRSSHGMGFISLYFVLSPNSSICHFWWTAINMHAYLSSPLWASILIKYYIIHLACYVLRKGGGEESTESESEAHLRPAGWDKKPLKHLKSLRHTVRLKHFKEFQAMHCRLINHDNSYYSIKLFNHVYLL